MKKSLVILLSLLLVISLFSSCANTSDEITDDGRPTVVTTTFPVYDWTRNIAGDRCNVIYLDKSGADMHSFEPTASVIATIAEADVFIHIGGVSDEWVDSALKAAGNEDLIKLSLMSAITVLEEETVDGMQIHHDESEDEEADEHIWLSLKKASESTYAICSTLCKADSDNADFYKANTEAYTKKLSALDSSFASLMSSAKRNTILVADRFPFRYLAEDYGIEYFAAFPGCSAESEASFETITFLINKTKELSLPCILVTESSDGSLADTINGETGAKILTLNSCQSVKQADIDNGLTYLSAMESNLSTLTEALG